MNIKPKILIVDDDTRLRYLLENLLKKYGFLVDSVADGDQMNAKIKHFYYDLIILDWVLPGEDGLTICKRLTSQDNCPLVIMLTAKNNKSDCLLSFNSGADDYISKPFNPDELIARIIAVLRRQSSHKAPSLANNYYLIINFGPYCLDITQRCIFNGSAKIKLSSTEFVLLNILAKNLGKVMSREQLFFLIKGYDSHPYDRFVDIHICRLRRLLEVSPSSPEYLQTVRNIGYILVG